jgi:hypothetical protein
MSHRSGRLALLPPRNTTKPVQENRSRDIESDIHPKQAKVPPARVPVGIDAHEELIRAVHLAEVALSSRLLIAQIPARRGYILCHIRATGLTVWQEERLELCVGAESRCLAQRSRHETRYQVGLKVGVQN